MKTYHLHRKSDFLTIINGVRAIITANQSSMHNRRSALVHKFTILMEYGTKVTTSLFFVVIACYLPYTFVMYAFYGRLVPITTVYVPGVDVTALRGFVITTVFHVLQFGLGCCCIAAIDVLMAILLVCPFIHSQLICLDVAELSGRLCRGSDSRPAVRAAFRNILLMVREMDV